MKAKPGNLLVELYGHRWDGAVLEVPMHAIDVHVSWFSPDVFRVDEPLVGHEPEEVIRYRVIERRCPNRECKSYGDRYASVVVSRPGRGRVGA